MYGGGLAWMVAYSRVSCTYISVWTLEGVEMGRRTRLLAARVAIAGQLARCVGENDG